tara:strand:- start:568 stop:1116 length:549 start_codon:yes stop_codon:yes gene_type:complete
MKKCLAFINESIYTNSLKAIGYSIQPEKVTIDKSGFNNAALKSINKYLAKDNKIEIRHIKYYNNIEQDHRFIKKITKPMQGFKAFKSAYATLIFFALEVSEHEVCKKVRPRRARCMLMLLLGYLKAKPLVLIPRYHQIKVDLKFISQEVTTGPGFVPLTRGQKEKDRLYGVLISAGAWMRRT